MRPSGFGLRRHKYISPLHSSVAFVTRRPTVTRYRMPREIYALNGHTSLKDTGYSTHRVLHYYSKLCSVHRIYCHVFGVTVDGVLDCQSDLLIHKTVTHSRVS
jgi:hypothetical protein